MMCTAVLTVLAAVVAAIYAAAKLSEAMTLLIRSWIPVILAIRELRRAMRGTAPDDDKMRRP